jgi:hypothetical protein
MKPKYVFTNRQEDRTIDLLIAKKLFKLKPRRFKALLDGLVCYAVNEPDANWAVGSVHGNLPYYSTNISIAWEILKKLQSKGKCFYLSWDDKFFTISNYSQGVPCRGWRGKPEFKIVAGTASLAICKAALKTLGVKVK